MLTDHDIAIVRAGWEKIAPVKERIADRFYARLFSLAPEIRSLFADDMDAQKRKLMTMLAIVIGALDTPEITPLVAALGARHADYGTRQEHYAVVEEALLDALADGLGADWTPAAALAWRKVYAELAETMAAT